MQFDPKPSFFDDHFLSDEWILHHLFTRVIFDSLVKDIVRDQFNIDSPAHLTLQVTQDQTVLFIWENDRAFVIEEDDLLFDWALDFVAADVLNIDPAEVDQFYIDAAIGGNQQPYVYIKGQDILFSSGQPPYSRRMM